MGLTVAADGRLWLETGHWAGNYRDWRRRRRLVHLDPEQFQAFKARLAPYRPDRDVVDDQADCNDYISDNDGAIVEWFSGGDKRIRVFDFGCRDDRAMVDAVRSAPDMLLTQAQKVR